MRLDKVLEHIGVTLVKVDRAPQKVVLFLRVGREDAHIAQWKSALEKFLLVSQGQEKWHGDVSKSYFISPGGAVKFLWRVIFTGDLRKGAEALGQAVIRGRAPSAEIMSVPLIGQVEYEFDPVQGKMKGGHSSAKAAQARTVGLGS